MRNLSSIDKCTVSCSLLKACQSASIERNVLYFANKNEICKLDVDSLEPETAVEILAPLDVGSVIDLKFLPEEDMLVLVSKTGSVGIFSLNSSELEIVGDVPGGISGSCWSPDMEILVVISEVGSILLMTRSWDVIQETMLFQEEFGEANFVNVGWGSKETQFHGSEGKNSRTKQEIQTTLAEWDDKQTRITWRADGLYFAVNAVDPNYGYRKIRVFNREGQLQSTSETVSQLEQSLSWRSSGASGLITTTVTLTQQNKQQVAFFEKNGLRHGEFAIVGQHKILESFWNGDSTILALLIDCGSDNKFGLEFWTMSNYHWYMKEFVPFNSSIQSLWIMWDPIETNRIHYVTSNGAYNKIDFCSTVDCSKGLDSTDPACVAVIDNRILKLTFLREAVIPPPMCGWEIEFPDAIKCIDLTSLNSLVVVTHSGHGHVFRFENVAHTRQEDSERLPRIHRREGRSIRPTRHSSFFLDFNQLGDLRQLKWINSNTLVATLVNQLVLLEIDEKGIVSIKLTFPFESRVSSLVVSRDGQSVLIHLITGHIHQFSFTKTSLTECRQLPEVCGQIDSMAGHLIGLAGSGRLYVDGQQVLTAVSSFVVHSDFLIVTSLESHQLLCLPFDSFSSSSLKEKIVERAVERGAKLVHAVPSATSVVLQMPRGNLEAVHPRALTLNILKGLIDRQMYSEAVSLMKKQRINMNLLCDHDPEVFLEHCRKFVEQISSGDVSNLNIFLSDLQNEDFTTTMYQAHYREKTIPSLDNKTNVVCSKLREVMEEFHNPMLLLPILTSFVKQGQVDMALKAVQILKEETTKDKALKYLAVLVDGDKLYKEALATYDLHLTLMVAQRSQKDPKEYLSFLNELNDIEDEQFRCFSIDNSLKKYDSALRHLSRCQPVKAQQLTSYMKLHRIYTPVIDELCAISPIDSESREVLHTAACLQADTFSARENHEEAGYLYQRVELYEKAINSFQKCGLWKNCLGLASLLQFSDEETTGIVTKLVASLRSAKKYMDAAFLCEYYLKDYQQSVKCLTDNLFFSEAWALCAKYNLNEWAETALKKELEDAFKAMEVKLEHVESESSKYSQRLQMVRQNLLQKLENPQPSEMDHGDLFSETGSSVYTHSTATSSGKTFMSSKNRRKHERKKFRLKEGSPFEDMAIINELFVLYGNMNTILQEIGRVLRGELLVSKDWNRAKKLQKKTQMVVKQLEMTKISIWNFTVNNKSQDNGVKIFGPSATTEMIISQVNKEKDEFFLNRYMELDPKIRNAPDNFETSWFLDTLK